MIWLPSKCLFMKISKLFHWLYATVMLLPIFAVLVTCLYAIINQNAYKSYSALNENTEALNIVNTTNDFDNSRVYYFQTSSMTHIADINRSSGQFYIEVLENDSIYPNISNANHMQLDVYNTSTSVYIIFYDENNNQVYNGNSSSLNALNIKMLIRSYIDDTWTGLNYILENTNSLYYIDYFTYQQIDNVFYYAVDQVKEAPIFSWAYNSFLAEPIVYITNLFSIPSNHIVIEFLSYWLAISLIWLVFDVIMYVPLLVHRWLDKAGLQ